MPWKVVELRWNGVVRVLASGFKAYEQALAHAETLEDEKGGNLAVLREVKGDR